MKVKIICAKPQRYCGWFDMHHASMEEYVSLHAGYSYVKDIDYSPYAKMAGYIKTEPCTCPQTAAELQGNVPGKVFAESYQCVRERIIGGRKMIPAMLSDCDLLLILGPDTVITNMTIKAEDVMPKDAHILMCKEEGYECDCIMARNTKQARKFFEDWLDWMLDESHPVWRNYGNFVPPFCRTQYGVGEGFDTPNNIAKWHDDVVLSAVCERYPDQSARIHTLERKGFAVKHVHWDRGDWIMHTPGSPDEDRIKYMRIGMDKTVREKTDTIGRIDELPPRKRNVYIEPKKKRTNV